MDYNIPTKIAGEIMVALENEDLNSVTEITRRYNIDVKSRQFWNYLIRLHSDEDVINYMNDPVNTQTLIPPYILPCNVNNFSPGIKLYLQMENVKKNWIYGRHELHFIAQEDTGYQHALHLTMSDDFLFVCNEKTGMYTVWNIRKKPSLVSASKCDYPSVVLTNAYMFKNKLVFLYNTTIIIYEVIGLNIKLECKKCFYKNDKDDTDTSLSKDADSSALYIKTRYSGKYFIGYLCTTTTAVLHVWNIETGTKVHEQNLWDFTCPNIIVNSTLDFMNVDIIVPNTCRDEVIIKIPIVQKNPLKGTILISYNFVTFQYRFVELVRSGCQPKIYYENDRIVVLCGSYYEHLNLYDSSLSPPCKFRMINHMETNCLVCKFTDVKMLRCRIGFCRKSYNKKILTLFIADNNLNIHCFIDFPEPTIWYMFTGWNILLVSLPFILPYQSNVIIIYDLFSGILLNQWTYPGPFIPVFHPTKLFLDNPVGSVHNLSMLQFW